MFLSLQILLIAYGRTRPDQGEELRPKLVFGYDELASSVVYCLSFDEGIPIKLQIALFFQVLTFVFTIQ